MAPIGPEQNHILPLGKQANQLTKCPNSKPWYIVLGNPFSAYHPNSVFKAPRLPLTGKTHKKINREWSCFLVWWWAVGGQCMDVCLAVMLMWGWEAGVVGMGAAQLRVGGKMV